MSAGNFLGSMFNTVFFAALWIIFGYVLQKLFTAFNYSMNLLPSMADAANGLTIMQFGFIVVPVIIFLVIWMNYLFNEISMAGGGV